MSEQIVSDPRGEGGENECIRPRLFEMLRQGLQDPIVSTNTVDGNRSHHEKLLQAAPCHPSYR